MKQLLIILMILATTLIVFSMGVSASEMNVTVTNVTVLPDIADIGENITIIATIKNVGNVTETVPIVFKINKKIVELINITIEANSTKIVEYVTVKKEAGIHNIDVNNKSASLTVISPITIAPPITLVTEEDVKEDSLEKKEQTQIPITPTPTRNKFRVGPVVRLRPVIDVIRREQGGIVELFINNPSLNDEALNMELLVSVPSGLHIYSTKYAWSTVAGVAYAPHIEIPPGTARQISIHIKADEYARIGSHTLHFSGHFWPGNNKDLFSPISLTYPIMIKEASKEIPPAPTSTELPLTPNEVPYTPTAPTIPGFETVFIIGVVLMMAYFIKQKK